MSEQAEQQSMLFQVDSPVSPFLWPVSKKGKRTTDIYGPKCFASSESLNRITSSVRMYLESSTSRLTRFVPTWSVKATKSGFLILKLRLSERRTGESGSRLWPTPKTPTGGGQVARNTPGGGIRKLEDAVSAEVGYNTGALNPTWVEWLMGYEIGWTDLNASETP